jgi:hypothetical protein
MMLRMRRLVAAILAVFVFAGGLAAAAQCAGWQPTPAARMACCVRAHDTCPDQTAADACCARSEQGQQPITVAVSGDGRAVRSAGAAAVWVPSVLHAAVGDAARVEPIARLPRPPGSPPVTRAILRI